MKKFLSTFIIGLLCLFLLSCTTTGGSSVEDNKPTYNFVFVCPNVADNDYWGKCIAGIHDAEDEINVNVTILGGTTYHDEITDQYWSDNFHQYFQQAIDMQPDGIMAYCGLESLSPYLEQAKAKNIPVIAIDSDAINTDNRIAFVGTKMSVLGVEACKSMADITTGTAKVGVVWSDKSSVNEQNVYKGFTETAQNYEFEIVSEIETGVLLNSAKNSIKTMLTNHPEITALFTMFAQNAYAAALYKEENQLNDLVVFGFDDTVENLEYTRKGYINNLTVQEPYFMGYKGVKLLSQYLTKQSLPKTQYYTASVNVNKNNIDTYKDTSIITQTAIKDVTVGFYTKDVSHTEQEINAFQSIDQTTNRKSGYAYDYYHMLSSYAGWNYTFTHNDDTGNEFTKNQAIMMVVNDQLDIIAGVQKEDLDLLSINQGDILLSDQPMLVYENQEFYFAINKERIDLLVDLNNAIQQISEEHPFFVTSLHQKYMVEEDIKSLTDNEEQWLDAKKTLTIGYLDDSLPLSDLEENGQVTGLVSYFLEVATDYLNIDVKSRAYKNVTDMQDGLKNGEIDAVFPVCSDYWIGENNQLRITNSVFTDRIMIVYNETYSENMLPELLKSVASSPRAIGQKDYFNTYYPTAEIEYYDTLGQAIDAVKNRTKRSMISSSSCLQRYLSDNPDIEINISYLDLSVEFAIATRETDNTLVSILNKVISRLDDATISSTIVQFSSVEHHYNVTDFLKDNMVLVVVFFTLFSAILATVFVSYIIKAKHFNLVQAQNREKLENALTVAEKASQAKTTFLSSMSHDIRTPMNAIVGMTAIATKYIDDKNRVQECLNKISLSSNHLLTLINDVLDISKIESGKIMLNPTRLSLRDTITNMYNIVKPLINDKKIDLKFYIHNLSHECVYGDAVRVNQVFMNILSNAVKYTPNGGNIVVEFYEEPLADNNIRLTYIVKDNGIGMSEDFLKTMYDSFSRAKDSRINEIQGTGLGLSIVKQMVTIMNGTIDCESKLNVGTKFTVKLDFELDNDYTFDKKLSNVKILVVDLDQTFLDDTGHMLDSMCADYTTLTNLDLLQQDSYDLVILDWNFIESHNYNIQQIYSKSNLSTAKVLVSTYDVDSVLSQANNLGYKNFISKPVFTTSLYERLYDLLFGESEKANDQFSYDDIKGLHLLIAEDNQINWEVISVLLETLDITCARAENGRRCVEEITSAKKGTYDMIIMDVEMPEMNGKEATKLIRSSNLDYVRDIPIIAMTANSFSEDIASCLECGMNAHLSKPIDLDKLCQMIRKFKK